MTDLSNVRDSTRMTYRSELRFVNADKQQTAQTSISLRITSDKQLNKCSRRTLFHNKEIKTETKKFLTVQERSIRADVGGEEKKVITIMGHRSSKDKGRCPLWSSWLDKYTL